MSDTQNNLKSQEKLTKYESKTSSVFILLIWITLACLLWLKNLYRVTWYIFIHRKAEVQWYGWVIVILISGNAVSVRTDDFTKWKQLLNTILNLARAVSPTLFWCKSPFAASSQCWIHTLSAGSSQGCVMRNLSQKHSAVMEPARCGTWVWQWPSSSLCSVIRFWSSR